MKTCFYCEKEHKIENLKIILSLPFKQHLKLEPLKIYGCLNTDQCLTNNTECPI